MTQNLQNDQEDIIADVLESTTLLACPSQNQKIKFKSSGVIAKIPVVIAEPKIQINVESTIRLESPALEIKRIIKSLFLTQCELIPTDEKKSGKLFLSGFVRKNIEYATTTNVRTGAISGDIRHTTVNIPFNCFAKIDFIEEPDFEKNEGPFQLEVINCDGMGNNASEQNFIQTEKFNEKVFCELIEAKFREKDIILNPRAVSPQFPNIRVFDTFVEKMVIDVTIKVLQKQQVEIPKARKKDEHHDRDDKDDRDDRDDRDDKSGRRDRDDKDDRDDKCCRRDRDDKDDRDDKRGRRDKDDRDDRDDKCCRRDRDDRDCRRDKDDRDKCCRDDRERRDDWDRCSRDDWRKRDNWDRSCSGKKTACWRC